MNQISVMLVDDHDLFREGLSTIINNQPDMRVIGEAGDGLEAVVKAEELQPDLILMDIQMPGFNGLEATRKIKLRLPETTVVVLTVRDDEEKLFEAIKSGAQGYLLKNTKSAEVLELLRGAVRGEAAISPMMAGRMLEEFRRMSRLVPVEEDPGIVDLTLREGEVLSLVLFGKADKEIASQLGISLYTVKSHLRSILSKLQVNSRREAARLARDKGLL